MSYVLQSTTKPEIRFKILAYNKATSMMKLQGTFATFEEEMTKEKMDLYKYRIEKEQEHGDQV